MTIKIYIDGSNMWYRAYTATELYRPGGPVSVMTYMLRKICREYGKDNVTVCWDAGDGGRKKLDPSYKAQRKPVEGVWEDIVYIKTMVDVLGIGNAHQKGFEADDVAGSLAVQYPKESVILSYDKDFYQLVDDSISILRPARIVRGNKIPRLMVGRDEVMEEFGVPPEKVALFKAFRGDISDNIPKLNIKFTKKFKEPFFKALLSSDTISEFYDCLDLFDDKYRETLREFRDRAELNLKLVTIRTDLDVNVERPKMNTSKFADLCEELEIKRLKIDDWTSMPKEAPPPPPAQGCLF